MALRLYDFCCIAVFSTVSYQWKPQSQRVRKLKAVTVFIMWHDVILKLSAYKIPLLFWVLKKIKKYGKQYVLLRNQNFLEPPLHMWKIWALIVCPTNTPWFRVRALILAHYYYAVMFFFQFHLPRHLEQQDAVNRLLELMLHLYHP